MSLVQGARTTLKMGTFPQDPRHVSTAGPASLEQALEEAQQALKADLKAAEEEQAAPEEQPPRVLIRPEEIIPEDAEEFKDMKDRFGDIPLA